MGAGDFDAATAALIWTRDQGKCADCGRPVVGERGRDWSIHHRRPRGQGGTSLAWVGMAANGVLIHGSGTTGCHGRRERERRTAINDGFLISALGVATALTTCIKHAIYGWVLLDNEGGWVSAEGYGKDWAEL